MAAMEIAMASRDANGRKAIFLKRKSTIMVRNSTGDGESEFVAKVELSEPEGFGLEVGQRSLNELSKHSAPNNGIMEWWNNGMMKSILILKKRIN
ncbi:MAG: hypothetical protein Q7V12_11715, partial [Deltaproteobacteria bacterium]|nr:hypothetical protein [Deltaproteobacteria bacterium]